MEFYYNDTVPYWVKAAFNEVYRFSNIFTPYRYGFYVNDKFIIEITYSKNSSLHGISVAEITDKDNFKAIMRNDLSCAVHSMQAVEDYIKLLEYES